MKLNCPVRGFCNKYTRSILAAGILLLLTGLVFCDYESVLSNKECATTATAAKPEEIVTESECGESGCQRVRKKQQRVRKKQQRPINIQQDEMKTRLDRINRKIEKLTQKRKKIKHGK